jgi:hypothetical protein
MLVYNMLIFYVTFSAVAGPASPTFPSSRFNREEEQ